MKLVGPPASVAALALASLLSCPSLAGTPADAARARIAALAVPFVANGGQWDQRAAFAAQTFAGTLFVSREGQLVYSLPGKPISDDAPAVRTALKHGQTMPARRGAGWVLVETLVDGTDAIRHVEGPLHRRTSTPPAGIHPLPGKVSYSVGDDTRRHANGLDSFERVSLGQVYPGIDVQLRATGSNVEKIFTVAPDGQPERISIHLAGAERLELGAGGELIAHTGNGVVAFTAPVAFQDGADGVRADVAVRYTLDAASQRYGFAVGEYDRGRPLVIDPLLQSTYLGGSADDEGRAFAIHPATGDIYVAGMTNSTDLPGVAGGAQSTAAASRNVFVTRFNAALTSRLQSTYLGGNGQDEAFALAIHPVSGDVYIVGRTDSTDLPGRIGGAQSAKAGDADAFVTRLNASLTSVTQSSYLGGIGYDTGYALAIHPLTGDVYVGGYGGSSSLPGLSGGAQSTYAGEDDGFITRFNAALTTVLQSTFIGGEGYDLLFALAIHPATGDVYAAGSTLSSSLPGVAGGAQAAKSGSLDAYVARFNAALTSRLQATYIGGAGSEFGRALAIHPVSGEVYVGGSTSSSDFPGVAGGYQSTKAANDDGFVVRLNAALTARLQSTYLGGNGLDQLEALRFHPATGELYLSGTTDSANFPGVSTGAQTASGGNYDAFVARIDAALTGPLQASYLGGSGIDSGLGLAIHPTTGDIYLGLFTTSGDLPGRSGGAQGGNAGGYDAAVARFSADLTSNDQLPDAFAFASQTNVPLTSIRTSNPVRITGLASTTRLYVDGAPGSSYCVSSGNNCACDLSTQFTSTPGSISNNSYVCVRHVSAAITDEVVRSRLHVGGNAATFVSTTGTRYTQCSLDIDGSGGPPNAASDGLMLVRAMLGFTGSAVTSGAISGTPPRNTWALIRDYLNQNCGTAFAP